MFPSLIFLAFLHILLQNLPDYNKLPIVKNNGANTNATIVINLINMLIEGPEVSLNGSPTVSPTTAALCASLFRHYYLLQYIF